MPTNDKPEHHVRDDAGFSLIEVLAALMIFAVAAIGLLRVTTENTSAVHRIETRALARIVADNQIAATLIQRTQVEKGEKVGVVDMAGRRWRWKQTIGPTPNPLVLQVTVTVREIDEESNASDQQVGVDAEISAYETIR